MLCVTEPKIYLFQLTNNLGSKQSIADFVVVFAGASRFKAECIIYLHKKHLQYVNLIIA